MQDAMAGIEMVKFSLEPSSLPPSPSPVLAKPDISLHQVRPIYCYIVLVSVCAYIIIHAPIGCSFLQVGVARFI